MIHNNKVRGVIIIAWLTVIGVMSDGKYSQLKVNQVFTKTGLLNLKVTNNMFIRQLGAY